MADNSSTDSDVDALLQKIANKLSKSAKKCFKKKKLKKGKRLEEKENVPKTDAYKPVTASENVKDGRSPLNCETFQKVSLKQKSLCGKHSDGQKVGKTTRVIKVNELEQPPNESILGRYGQLCMYSTLYSDTSFTEDIGIPLIESTRIYSRESIAALDLGDSTFHSTVSTHSLEDVFGNDSYEQLTVKQNKEDFNKNAPPPVTIKKVVSSEFFNNRTRFSYHQELMTIIPDSDDEASEDKYYSVLEQGPVSVEDSLSDLSCEIQDTCTQTEEFGNLSLRENACTTSDCDTVCKDVGTEEESFVELVDTSMQTESNLQDNKICKNKPFHKQSLDSSLNMDHGSKQKALNNDNQTGFDRYATNDGEGCIERVDQRHAIGVKTLTTTSQQLSVKCGSSRSTDLRHQESVKTSSHPPSSDTSLHNLGEASSNKKKNEHTKTTRGSWRPSQEISESSDDEDLELFFQNIRSSLKSKYKSVASDKESDDEGNVDGFIVSDSNFSSDDDDDHHHHHFEDCDPTSPQLPTENHLLSKTPVLKTSSGEAIQLRTPKISNSELCFSSGDSDEEFLQCVTPRVTKSVSSCGRNPQRDRDVDVFTKPATSAVTAARKPAAKGSSNPKQGDGANCSFLKSLTADLHSESKRHQEAVKYVTSFKKHKDELIRRLFIIFNCTVFENKLPARFEIEWNKRLLRTAGYCVYQKGYQAKIQLSTKVCDTAERVRDTLIHELCHAAVWMLNNRKDGHGACWKYWARKANRSHPEIPVIARCHSYSINTKYTYECSQCGYSIGRHSKSLDTERKVCGHCHGRFEVRLTSESSSALTGTPRTPRTPNRFALFVKDRYGELKKKHKSFSHKDIMQTLSREFAEKNTIGR